MTCPACGYCPACGRSNQTYQPTTVPWTYTYQPAGVPFTTTAAGPVTSGYAHICNDHKEAK